MLTGLANSFKSTFSYTGLRNDAEVGKKRNWGTCRRLEWILLTVGYWLAFSAYLFLLPWLSDTFNSMFWDRSTWQGPLCQVSVFTPGLECKNGDDLVELAISRNRTYICGCGQGLFGEALCPVVPGGFSVSFFIGSSTATAIFTFLSFWPMLSLWWYLDWLEQFHNPPKDLLFRAFQALCGVQVFYGLLCCTQVCFFPLMQSFCWVAFLLCWFTHIFYIAYMCYQIPGLRKAFHVIATMVCIVVGANAGMIISSDFIKCTVSMHVCTYGYWFFQSIMLSAISGMSCFLTVMANMEFPVQGTGGTRE